MTLVKDCFGKDSAYWGNNGNWRVVFAYYRDSELITESNLKYIKQQFKIDGIEDKDFPNDVKIERASHWAVGWIEYISINPENAEYMALTDKIEKSLEDYPILSDDLYSDMQVEAYENNIAEIEKEFSNTYNEDFRTVYQSIQDQCDMCAWDYDGYIDIYQFIKICEENNITLTKGE